MAEKDGGSHHDPSWGKHLGVGLQMLVGVVLGYFIGQALDRRYGWENRAAIIGAMLGMAAGMYLLIKDAIRMNKD